MSKNSTVYGHYVQPTHIRETDDDGRRSTLYEYDDSIIRGTLNDHKGKAVEISEHDKDGTTDAYEYDDSIIRGTLNDHKGDQKNDDGGGCFLTTACVQFAGLPDNCHELT